jgi:hypothetical protein
MLKSGTTTSGAVSSAAVIAAQPLAASPTTSIPEPRQYLGETLPKERMVVRDDNPKGRHADEIPTVLHETPT